MKMLRYTLKLSLDTIDSWISSLTGLLRTLLQCTAFRWQSAYYSASNAQPQSSYRRRNIQKLRKEYEAYF
jgi:hypothetical protein